MKNLVSICHLALVTVSALTPILTWAKSAPQTRFANCEMTTLDQRECYSKVGDRAAEQLNRDWAFLKNLAQFRNRAAVEFLNRGHSEFFSYLEKNCESEGHDAMGGSLQDVLEQKCRRDLILERRHLFEQMAERNPLGRHVEAVLGRPICNAYLNSTKPETLNEGAKTGDVEILRSKLDKKGLEIAMMERPPTVSGGLPPDPALVFLPRTTHIEAEVHRNRDAGFTCTGILMAFCPKIAKQAPDRDAWLMRCETELKGSFYRRVTQRLKNYAEGENP